MNAAEDLEGAMAEATMYTVETGEQIMTDPPMPYRIDDVIPEHGVSMIYGASGAGKSFIVLDIAAAAAEGRPWWGNDTQQCNVLYMSLEGSGLRNRITAWAKHNKRGWPAGALILRNQGFQIDSPKDELGLVNLAKSHDCKLVFVDTLSQAMPGVDENAAQSMSEVMGVAQRVSREIGGAVVLVHHTGHNGDRVRGSTAITGALDVAIRVDADKAKQTRSWTITKSREGPEHFPHPFALESVVVGETAKGKTIFSAVILPDKIGEELAKVDTQTHGMGGNQETAFLALRAEIEVNGEVYPEPQGSKGQKAITEERAKEVAVRALAENWDSKKKSTPTSALKDVWDGKTLWKQLERGKGLLKIGQPRLIWLKP